MSRSHRSIGIEIFFDHIPNSDIENSNADLRTLYLDLVAAVFGSQVIKHWKQYPLFAI